ncbi:MAG: hypothetical protein ACRD0P_19000 [Stackebrandtia sp.]
MCANAAAHSASRAASLAASWCRHAAVVSPTEPDRHPARHDASWNNWATALRRDADTLNDRNLAKVSRCAPTAVNAAAAPRLWLKSRM